MSRRVVITGIGPVAPCGEGRDAFWQSALDARPGLGPLEAPEFEPLPIASAGLLKDFKASKYVANRKSLKVMCRDIQIAVAASALAWQDAGFTPESVTPDRAGVSIGAGLFNNELEELAESFRLSASESGFDTRAFGQAGMAQLFPLWLLKYLPNMPACHITIAHGLRGPSNTLTADASSSAAAIEEAFHVIRRGSADVMMCGGAESKINAAGLLRYHKLNTLAVHSNGKYPVFSEDASGIIPGEGGVILVLEEYEHAKKRGARVYAEMLSAFSCVSLDGAGAGAGRSRLHAMQSALEEGGAAAADVAAVHLSACGILADDRAEAESLRSLFASAAKKPALVATKPLTGFLGYAAAAAETAFAALGAHSRKLPALPLAGRTLLSDGFRYAGGDIAGRGVILVNHFVSGLLNHTFALAPLEGGSR